MFFSFTVIIWLPGVCATQRFTISVPSPKKSRSPFSWIMFTAFV